MDQTFDPSDPLGLKKIVLPDNLKPYDEVSEGFHLPLARDAAALWPGHNVVICVWQNREDACAQASINLFPKTGTPENGAYVMFPLTAGRGGSRHAMDLAAKIESIAATKKWKHKPSLDPSAVSDIVRGLGSFLGLMAKVACHPLSKDTLGFGIGLFPEWNGKGRYQIGIHHGLRLHEAGKCGTYSFTAASTLPSAVRLLQFHTEGAAKHEAAQRAMREQEAMVRDQQKRRLDLCLAGVKPGDIVQVKGAKRQTSLRIVASIQKMHYGYEVRLRSIPTRALTPLFFKTEADFDQHVFVTVPAFARPLLLKAAEWMSKSERFYIDAEGKWIVRLTKRLILAYKQYGGPDVQPSSTGFCPVRRYP